jgi:hypothetical protein
MWFMAGLCDIERCYNKGTHEVEQTRNYMLCTEHDQEWRSSGLRLRANPKKHTLKLVEGHAALMPEPLA